MVDEWATDYADAPGARVIVEAHVREWFAQQLVETVLGAQALAGSPRWTAEAIDAELLSEGGLTAALLPRIPIALQLRKRLNQKLGRR